MTTTSVTRTPIDQSAHLLLALNRVIFSSLEIGEVLSAVTRTAAEIVGAPFVSLWTTDEATQTLRAAAASDEAKWADWPVKTLTYDHSVTGEVVRTRRPVYVPDIATDRRIAAPDWYHANGLTSYYGTPIIFQGSVLGVLNLNGHATFVLGPDEKATLTWLADLAGIAIHNALLYAASERRRQTAEALAELGRTLAQSLDSEVVARELVKSVAALLKTEITVVYRLDPASRDLVAVAGVGPSAEWSAVLSRGTGASGRAVKERRPIATADALSDPTIELAPDVRASLERSSYRAVLAVPLVIQDRAIGALAVGDRAGRVYDAEDTKVLETFADQAAIAIEGGRIHRESERQRKGLATLVETTRRLTRGLDLPVVLGSLVEAAGQLFGGEAGVRLVEGDDLVRFTTTPGAEPLMAALRIRVGESVSGHVALTGEAVVSDDVAADERVPLVHRQAIELAGLNACMCVPIRLGEQILGTLHFFRRRDSLFDADDLRLATGLADHAAVAIHNSRLYAASEQRRETAEALAELGRVVAQSLDSGVIAGEIVKSVRDLLRAEMAVVYRLDPESGDLVWLAGVGAEIEWSSVMPRGTGAVGLAVQQRRPIVTADALSDPNIVFVPAVRARIERAVSRSVVAVPLIVQNRVIGALAVGDRVGRVFDADETRLLCTFGDQAAVAIEGGRIHRESERQRKGLATLVEMTQRLTRGLDLPTVLGSLVDAAGALFGCQAGVRLVEGDYLVRFKTTPGAESLMARLQVKIGESVSGLVASTREAIIVDDVGADPRMSPDHRRAVERAGLTAFMCVPIRLGDRVLGTLHFFRQRGSRFDEDDLQVATALADHAAIAIENVRVLATSEHRRRTAEALAEVGQTLAQSLDPEEVSARILDTVCSLLGVHCPVVYHLERSTGELVATAISPEVRGVLGQHFVWARGTGVEWRAVEAGRPVTTPNLLEDPRVSLPADVRARFEEAPYRAVLAVPLIVHDQVIGVLSVGDGAGRIFDEDEVRLAQAFADQAALALQNAQVLHESRVRQERVEALLAVSRQLAAIQPVESLLRSIAESCRRVLDCESVGFRVVEGDELVLTGIVGDAYATKQKPRLKFGESLSGKVAASGQTMVVFNPSQDPRVLTEHRAAMQQFGHQVWVGVPVKLGERVVGVLSIRTRREQGFSDPELAIATAFAAQAAIALENARLFSEVGRRAQHLETLVHLTQLISSVSETAQVFGFITKSAFELLDARLVRLWVHPPDSPEMTLESSWGPDPDLEQRLASPTTGLFDHGLIRHIAESRESQFVADLPNNAGALDPALARELGVVAFAGVPLIVGDHVVGVLAVFTGTSRSFDQDERDVLKIFADHAAIGIEKSRLYEETRRALGHLETKNLELDSFVYMVSHDLKAPLVTIQGMSNMLLEDCTALVDERGRRYLARIDANVRQMEQLISDLLALSRIGREARPAERVSLVEVVDEVLKELSPPIRARGVKVVRGDRGALWAIRTQLSEVVLNLVSNSVKYMGDVPEPRIEIGSVERGKWVECWVRDNGIGIDPAYHEQIFEVFQRLQDVTVEGTGVGLSIVKKIVEAAGGRVWVESSKGRGATFYFTWPVGGKQG